MMLKHTASSISPILCSIFNLSLSTGRIPDAWKLSRVVPVFKAGDPHEVSNYRPISLQQICGKLLEKDHPQKYPLPSEHQWYSYKSAVWIFAQIIDL